MNFEFGFSTIDGHSIKTDVARILTAALIFSLVACSNKGETAEESGVIQNPAYGEWQDREQPPIRFELEQTFGSESDEDGFMFASSGSIIGPVADQYDNIYMLDRERAKLLSFDSEGNLRWQTGEEGRGPGDFLRPSGIAINDRHLFLDNENGTRVDQYDLEGNFITSFPLPSDESRSVRVRGILDNGLLVASSSIMGTLGNRISIFKLSDSLSLVNRFDVEGLQEVETGKEVSATFSVTVMDSLIACGNFGNYALRFYSEEGEEVKTIIRKFDELVLPGMLKSGSVRAIRLFGSLGAPRKLSQQYFVTVLNWPTNVEDPDDYLKRSMNGDVPNVEFSSSLDLYRSDGTLLYSLEQNQRGLDIGYISYVDDQGNIYTRTGSPYPQVRRYDVNINGKGI